MQRRNVGVLALLAAVSVVSFAVHRSQALPAGPQPIGWDRESCTECHMLISDRHFAAQLQAADGAIRNFDDPGCLMLYVAHQRTRVHAMYFLDSKSGQWLRSEEAGFARSTNSPMGRGLTVVRKTVSGALSYAQALQNIEAESLKEAK